MSNEQAFAGRSRLLIVVNVPWFFVMHRLPLALMARARGIDVHIACGEGPGREDIERAGLRFHSLPLTRTRFAPWRDVKTILAMQSLYRKLQPTVVHHVTLKPVILGSIAARLAGVRGVINAFAGLGSTFSTSPFTGRLRRRFVLRLIGFSLKLQRQVTVFENREDRALLVDAAAVAADDAVVIAGTGVDTAEYSPSPEPAAPVRVLMGCRMIREKGVHYFVDVARRFRQRGLGARFLLVGSPDPFNPGSITEQELDHWNREGIVEWRGFQRDMPEVLRASHIVCLPTYYGEGVPRILLEGAASGRPLVTSDVPGCRDIVRDGVNGFLVPPCDPDSLERALERLLFDPELRSRFGAAGRDLVERRFALQRVFDRFWDLYLSAGLRAEAS